MSAYLHLGPAVHMFTYSPQLFYAISHLMSIIRTKMTAWST